MTPDKTTSSHDDTGLDLLDRESFAWWILGQIEQADRSKADYGKRGDPRIDCLHKIQRACYAIVQDTILETTPLSEDQILLTLSERVEAKSPPPPAG